MLLLALTLGNMDKKSDFYVKVMINFFFQHRGQFQDEARTVTG